MSEIKLIDFWKPMTFCFLIGVPLGLGVTLYSIDATNFLLEKILKNSVFGLITFGSYYMLLGISTIAAEHHLDDEELKIWVVRLSVPKWMSLISGVLVGISIAALCKSSGINAIGMLIFAGIFIAITWMVRAYEIEVTGESREGKNLRLRAWLAPITSLIVGSIAFCMAWHEVCSCGGRS
jgi:hypothetical protein